jgi:hypothetical protein
MLVPPRLRRGTRNASASDPAYGGTCGPSALAKGSRAVSPPASASGARSLRRDGTTDPRGGIPPAHATLSRSGRVRHGAWHARVG